MTAAEKAVLAGIGDPAVRDALNQLGVVELPALKPLPQSPGWCVTAHRQVQYTTPDGVTHIGVARRAVGSRDWLVQDAEDGSYAIVPQARLEQPELEREAEVREAIRQAARPDPRLRPELHETREPIPLNKAGTDLSLTLAHSAGVRPDDSDIIEYVTRHYPGARVLDAEFSPQRVAVVIHRQAGGEVPQVSPSQPMSTEMPGMEKDELPGTTGPDAEVAASRVEAPHSSGGGPLGTREDAPGAASDGHWISRARSRTARMDKQAIGLQVGDRFRVLRQTEDSDGDLVAVGATLYVDATDVGRYGDIILVDEESGSRYVFEPRRIEELVLDDVLGTPGVAPTKSPIEQAYEAGEQAVGRVSVTDLESYAAATYKDEAQRRSFVEGFWAEVECRTQKRAVDQKAKDYWVRYYGGYGKKLVERRKKKKVKKQRQAKKHVEAAAQMAWQWWRGAPPTSRELTQLRRVLAGLHRHPDWPIFKRVAQDALGQVVRQLEQPEAQGIADKVVVDYLARAPMALRRINPDAYEKLLGAAVRSLAWGHPKEMERLKQQLQPKQPGMLQRLKQWLSPGQSGTGSATLQPATSTEPGPTVQQPSLLQSPSRRPPSDFAHRPPWLPDGRPLTRNDRPPAVPLSNFFRPPTVPDRPPPAVRTPWEEAGIAPPSAWGGEDEISSTWIPPAQSAWQAVPRPLSREQAVIPPQQWSTRTRPEPTRTRPEPTRTMETPWTGPPTKTSRQNRRRLRADEQRSHRLPPAKGDLRLRLAQIVRDGDYLRVTVIWDPDLMTDMSLGGLRHNVISYVKDQASHKEYVDMGTFGKPRLTLFDADAGLAEVKVRSSGAKAFPPLFVEQSESEVYREPSK